MRRLLFLTLTVGIALTAIVVSARPEGGPSFPAAPARAVGEMCTPARPHASGTTVENVSTPDGLRPYRLHVPASYTGSDPVPIVIALHGAGSNAFEQEAYSGFSTKSDSEGFIVAYPEGKLGALTFTHFNAWQFASPPEPNDVAYIGAILDALNTSRCVDQSRVYSTGISNGGMMSVRLACSLSSRIAALAPVAGAYFPPMAFNVNPAEVCPDTVARPFISFHGTADDTVPFQGGLGGAVNYRLPQDDNTPAEDVTASWAAHNGCTGPRQETQIDTEIRLLEYASCADGTLVRLYAVDGGGHTWPGSFDVPSLGYTTHQISATDLIWSFFSGYTLPDGDDDTIPDGADICPAAANFDQLNTDRNFIDNSPPYAPATDDKTLANSDVAGDACDDDDDNDGLADTDEASGAACASILTNPLLRDTDGDRVLDGAECALGFDPTSAAAFPALAECGANTDVDGDGISARIEDCYYHTDAVLADTDGDVTFDGCEIASVNGDSTVNSGDQGMLGAAIVGTVAYTANVDINKDGVLNSGDQGLQASFIVPPGQCP